MSGGRVPQLIGTAKRVIKPLVDRHSSFIGSVVSVRTDRNHVVLTYDDGPEPGGTDRILEVLRKREVSATFFILVGRARKFPSLLGEIVAAGHETALHGLDHRALTTFGYRDALRRTADGRAELEDLTGRQVVWFRPPYGRQTPLTWHASRRAGLVPVLWGPTTWDWRDISQAERVASALRGAEAGSILLAHDGHAGPADGAFHEPDPPQLDRGDLAARVLDAYAERGLGCVSLSASLHSGELVKSARFRR